MNLIEFEVTREFGETYYFPKNDTIRFKYGIQIKEINASKKFYAEVDGNGVFKNEIFDSFDDAREFCTNVLLDEIDSKEKLYQEIKQILNPKKRYTLEDLRLLYLEYESTSKVKYFTEWLEEKEKRN